MSKTDIDFDALLTDKQVETVYMPSPRQIIAQHKRQMKAALRKEKAAEILTALPAPGESLHVVSNGTFDYFDFIPIACRLLGEIEAFYGSTWTMNRQNVLTLLDLFDNKKIKNFSILTGNYFKRRETAVYATLFEGASKRKQRVVTFKNHAKVMCFDAGDNCIVIEGSANFTANPRLEQTVIVNDRKLYEFHTSWMEDVFGHG